MAGEKDEKKKSSKSSGGEKDKAKKDKSSSDKKSSKSDVKVESKSKDKKSSDMLLDRKIELDKKLNGSTAAKPSAPKPRGPPPAKAPSSAEYLADFDLPSSESESDEEVERRRVDESSRIIMAQASIFSPFYGICVSREASRIFH